MVFYLPGFPQTTKTVARPEQTPVGKVAFFYLRTTFLHLYTTYLISICLYIYNICVYNAHLMYYLQTLSLSLYIYTYSTYHPPIWDSLEHSKYLRTTYIFTYLVYPLYITYIYIHISSIRDTLATQPMASEDPMVASWNRDGGPCDGELHRCKHRCSQSSEIPWWTSSYGGKQSSWLYN